MTLAEADAEEEFQALRVQVLDGTYQPDFLPRMLGWADHARRATDAMTQRFRPWFAAIRRFEEAFGRPNLLARAEALLPVVALTVHGWRVGPEGLPQIERSVGQLRLDEIEVLFADDPWLCNLVTSFWEYAAGREELTSYPWNFTIPIADLCNARCTFCTSWLEGKALVTLDQIDALQEPIRHALYLGLVGHGEPMAHPKFGEIADRLHTLIDRRATLYTITNGYLIEQYFDRLERLNILSYSISLNAASAATHDAVMGLGPDGFDRVLRGLRKLVALRETSQPELRIYITMVVTAQNLHEVADFVRLGNELGVTEIWLRALLPQSTLVPGLNYHLLPPSQHPDFAALQAEALAAIAASRVPVQAEPDAWAADILPPGLREQVRRSPPPLVSREEAMRDRELRRRNDHLYAGDAKRFRGARSNEPGTLVTLDANGLGFSTAALPWAYALEFEVPAGDDRCIEVEVKVEAGTAGIGVLNAARDGFHDRHFLGAGFDGTVALALRPGERQSLIIENGQAEGGVTRGQIRRAATVGEAAHVLDIRGGVHVHNAADPLEDGLNPLQRAPRFACRAVYYNLYINEMFFRVTPCCYMQNTPGFEEIRFDGSRPFREAWNAPAMQHLRRTLRDGPLFAACRRCPEKW